MEQFFSYNSMYMGVNHLFKLLIIYLHKFVFISIKAIEDSIESIENL